MSLVPLFELVHRRGDARVNAVLADLRHEAGLTQPVADAAALPDERPELVLPRLGRAYLAMVGGADERRFFRLLLMEAMTQPLAAHSSDRSEVDDDKNHT